MAEQTVERLEDLSAQEQLVLKSADEIYCFDWRENDDDEKTSGWRHPGYFTEVNVAIDFPKLVSAGLMECDGNTEHTPSYRISERGMALVNRQQQPATPVNESVGSEPRIRTLDEIDNLKSQWRFDPCWDIEDTAGFESHHDELLEWRNSLESEMTARTEKRIADRAAVLGFSIEAMRFIERLESRIRALEIASESK